jgi:hypothetical protein
VKGELPHCVSYGVDVRGEDGVAGRRQESWLTLEDDSEELINHWGDGWEVRRLGRLGWGRGLGSLRRCL